MFYLCLTPDTIFGWEYTSLYTRGVCWELNVAEDAVLKVRGIGPVYYTKPTMWLLDVNM